MKKRRGGSGFRPPPSRACRYCPTSKHSAVALKAAGPATEVRPANLDEKVGLGGLGALLPTSHRWYRISTTRKLWADPPISLDAVAMPDSIKTTDGGESPPIRRADPPVADPTVLWRVLSNTPGVGVSIMDSRGALIFVNETSQRLFFDRAGVDYRGKTVHDFHPPAFCEERIEMIGRVLAEKRPMVIRHIYFGRRIESTLWPIDDRKPPYDRVVVVSHNHASEPLAEESETKFETFETRFIDLGPLDTLTQRELEVLVLLGHGLSVPDAAATLHRSPSTVQRHKEAISTKLAVHGQAALVSLVASIGLEMSDARLRRYGQ